MADSSTWLIVGLGNPGDRYSTTRHNVGHMVVDELAHRMGEKFTSHRSNTHIAQGRMGIGPGGVPGPKVIVARSNGYMNTSGGPVSALMKYLEITPERLIVIHDDLDLEPFDLRLKKGGGEGGHNGLKSLTQHLKTKDYHRLRIGIGRPPGRQEVADFVLEPMGSKLLTEYAVTVMQAADVIEDIVHSDFVSAQQRLHSRSTK